MRYYTLRISGGEFRLKEHPSREDRNREATEMYADLTANSGLFDDMVYQLDSEAPITVSEIEFPTSAQIAAAKKTRK